MELASTHHVSFPHAVQYLIDSGNNLRLDDFDLSDVHFSVQISNLQNWHGKGALQYYGIYTMHIYNNMKIMNIYRIAQWTKHFFSYMMFNGLKMVEIILERIFYALSVNSRLLSKYMNPCMWLSFCHNRILAHLRNELCRFPIILFCIYAISMVLFIMEKYILASPYNPICIIYSTYLVRNGTCLLFSISNYWS